MNEIPWSEMALPFIVAGELLYGAYYSSLNYREKNIQAVLALIEKITVIFPTAKSYQIYGQHKTSKVCCGLCAFICVRLANCIRSSSHTFHRKKLFLKF